MLLCSTALAAPEGTAKLPEAPASEPDLPEACRPLAKLAESTAKSQALSAKISLASCLADARLKPLVLCDCEQSVREIEEALTPSLELLDGVFAAGDPATQILARHTQGELLSNVATRMLATIPPPTNTSESAVALRDTRLDMLLPLIQPWQMRARSAYNDLDKIARANPQLAKNAAVLAAVRSSRAKLTTQSQTATR